MDLTHAGENQESRAKKQELKNTDPADGLFTTVEAFYLLPSKRSIYYRRSVLFTTVEAVMSDHLILK